MNGRSYEKRGGGDRVLRDESDPPVKNLKSVSVTEDLCEYDRQSSYSSRDFSS